MEGAAPCTRAGPLCAVHSPPARCAATLRVTWNLFHASRNALQTGWSMFRPARRTLRPTRNTFPLTGNAFLARGNALRFAGNAAARDPAREGIMPGGVRLIRTHHLLPPAVAGFLPAPPSTPGSAKPSAAKLAVIAASSRVPSAI